jgi:hypothetical protein
MNSEKWTALKAWYHTAYKSLPHEVSDAIETLLDERESADDDDEEEEED